MKNIVIFGVTGDLAKKKIIPALSKLDTRLVAGSENYIAKYIGFGRKDISVSDFQAQIGGLIQSPTNIVDAEVAAPTDVSVNGTDFIKKWTYVQSEIDDIAGYERLKGEIGDVDSLIYISLPPQLTEKVLAGLSGSGILSKTNTRNKLLIEKPFGHDLETALKLRTLLESDFNIDNVYLVDHYACKQAIVDFEVLGFEGFFGESHSLDDIQSIRVSILEKKGVDSRGVFYDQVGAIKDVGQNHCLRVLTSVLRAGEVVSVGGVSSRDSRESRTSILKSIVFDNVKKVQDPEYKHVEGISSESNTETYFEMSGKYNNSVDVIIEGGKYQAGDKSEIVIRLKDGRSLVLPINDYKGSTLDQDQDRVPDAYENVIKFAIEGQREYFVEFDEVLEQWRIVS